MVLTDYDLATVSLGSVTISLSDGKKYHVEVDTQNNHLMCSMHYNKYHTCALLMNVQ